MMLAAALLLMTAASAQGVKLYTKSGQMIDYPYTVLDSIVNIDHDVTAPEGVVAVDLGLPSGTKWANMNVGATAPEKLGDYFQWGETTPCTDQSENVNWNSNYTPGGMAFTGTDAPDCGTDKDPMFAIGILAKDTAGRWQCDIAGNPLFDAATANWGSVWRMPNAKQVDELCRKCTWKWTTLNDVQGYEVKSKTNGNSIFLPAPGFRLRTSVNSVGTGRYWASTVFQLFASHAFCLMFTSSSEVLFDGYRYIGYPIRPVAK